jgi:subtilisin family serine protease
MVYGLWFMVYEVDEVTINLLHNLEEVVSIQEDNIRKISLSESTPLIGSDNAWGMGYTGLGKIIAFVDTGVDKYHAFLVGKVVSEAFYSTTSSNTTSFCPSGSDEEGNNTGLNYDMNGCNHGSHVAGIAAGMVIHFQV